MRQLGREPHRLGQIGGQQRRSVAQAHRQADQCQSQNCNAERLVNRNERQIFRLDGRHHAHADEQHGQDADRHQPMQQALERREALAG